VEKASTPMSDVDWAISGWTFVARLVRPQGRHGEILADLLTDFPERFAERKRLFVFASETSGTPLREVRLEAYWLHKGRVVLKFEGIDSINDAERLRSHLVAIPANERIPLTDDSVYISDLIGCEVIDITSTRTPIGKVRDVDREGGLLIVQPSAGEEILIPFAKAYLAAIDIERKQIEMRLPAGLLDINTPITEEERRELDMNRDSERS
jgi:16S rRNA processing protein RimM